MPKSSCLIWTYCCNDYSFLFREKRDDKKIQDSQIDGSSQRTSNDSTDLFKCPVRRCNVVMTSKEATGKLGEIHLLRVHAMLPTKLTWIPI